MAQTALAELFKEMIRDLPDSKDIITEVKRQVKENALSARAASILAALQPATDNPEVLLELAQVVYGHRILAAAGLFDSAEDEDEILRDLREAEEKLADHVLGLLGLSPKRC